MNAIQKWKLDYKLSSRDINEIIFELFQGYNKTLYYDKNEKINKDLFELYSQFNGDCSKEFLSFSMSPTIKPFVSLNKFDDVKYVLKGEGFNVYIYE